MLQTKQDCVVVVKMTGGFLPFYLTVTLILSRLSRIGGEQQEELEDDYASTTTDEGNNNNNGLLDDDPDGLGSDDRVMLFFMFLVFGYIIALLGSMLAYISWQDDRILDLYLEEGLPVEGDVVSIEHTRGGAGGGQYRRSSGSNAGGKGGCSEYGKPEKEYLVSVEYVQFLSQSYPVRIRKQLRVWESEFVVQPDTYPASLYNNNNRSQQQQQPRWEETNTQQNPTTAVSDNNIEHSTTTNNNSSGGVSGNHVCSIGRCTSLELDGLPLDSITDCPQHLQQQNQYNNNAIIPQIEIGVSAGEDSFFQDLSSKQYGKKLHLLVLPNHHLSALPSRHTSNDG